MSMQVLLVEKVHTELKQCLFSPNELFIYLFGEFDREIYYLHWMKIGEIGFHDSIPQLEYNNYMALNVDNEHLIGYFHTHPNNQNIGSKLSGADIKFFQLLSHYWQLYGKKFYPILLGVGALTIRPKTILYDLKFYFLDKVGLPDEIKSHIVI